MIVCGGTEYVITASGFLETPRQVNAAIIAIKQSNARIVFWGASVGSVHYHIGFMSGEDYARFCEVYERFATEIVEKNRKPGLWVKIKRVFS